MILITRPKELAYQTKAKLKKVGFESYICPCLNIRALETKQPGGLFDGLVFTSVNALSATSNWSFPKNIKVFTVGEKTAQKARQIGYTSVISETTVDKLVETIKISSPSKLLHVCGKHLTKDLSLLNIGGKLIKKCVVYSTEMVVTLSSSDIEIIKNRASTILLYSKRSAQAFQFWCDKYNILLNEKSIYCLSAKVASVFEGYGVRDLKCPELPNEEHMLKLLCDNETLW